MKTKEGTKIKGRFDIEVYDKPGGKLISKSSCHNIVTNQGLDHILDVVLHGTAAIATWYCALFENDYTPLAGNTYAVPGYTECVAYDEATRPEYIEAASSGQSITNSANKAVFTANATKTLYGASLVGGGTAANTKGDIAGGGTLLCSGKFSASQPVVSGNVVNLTYTVSAADDGV